MNSEEKLHAEYHELADALPFDAYYRNIALRPLYPKQRTKKKLLDVGCGAGIIGEFFLKQNYDVYGTDISSQAAKLAKAKGLKVTICNITEGLPYADRFFDEIFMGDIVEHVYAPEYVIEECRRVLKPHGRLVMSTVNYSNIVWRIKYLLTGIIPFSEGGEVKNVGYWEHIRLWNDRELVEFIEKFGFIHKKTIGTNFFKIFPQFLYGKFPTLFSALNIYIFD